MNSMTGFGSGSHRGRTLELDVHVKSVNGRFLELRVHVPKEFAPFETELRKAFTGFDRGTIDVFVQRRPRREDGAPPVRVNEANARYWARALRDLNDKLKFSSEVTLRDVMAMPRVLESDEVTVDAAGEFKFVLRATRAAAAACAKVRAAEGARLARELLKLLAALEAAAKRLKVEHQSTRAQVESRLSARVAALGGDAVDPARLVLETALVMDKADVHEELVRLLEHVRACRALIKGDGARGKKLDFYCQELLREVNTVGSKAAGASLTLVVVEAKSLIEKFREQVQNIE